MDELVRLDPTLPTKKNPIHQIFKINNIESTAALIFWDSPKLHSSTAHLLRHTALWLSGSPVQNNQRLAGTERAYFQVSHMKHLPEENLRDSM
jgi:hypothetical protein